MYVAIDLPKGAKVPTDFSIDQLEGLHTARPTLRAVVGAVHDGPLRRDRRQRRRDAREQVPE